MSYLLLWSLLAAGAAQESKLWQACRHGAWLHQLACEVRSARYRHRSMWGDTGGEVGASNSRDSTELLRTALSPPGRHYHLRCWSGPAGSLDGVLYQAVLQCSWPVRDQKARQLPVG